MRRRRVLAALGPVLAGCASSPPSSRITTAPGTPLPGPITDCRSMPDPPPEPTREAAREFVRSHEEAIVYNWLVGQHGGPDECLQDSPVARVHSADVGAAGRVTVDEPLVALTAETDEGFYVLSTCSGQARYRCPDEGRLCSGAGKNADFVHHFVGDGRHVRVPTSATVCDVREDPYRSPDPAENITVPEDEPGLTFRVYDLTGGGRRDGSADGASVDVVVFHLGSGERVMGETYASPSGPLVATNVAVRSGAYRLVAVAGDRRVSHRFTIEGPDDPSLASTCVYLGPGDALLAVEVPGTGDLAPSDSLCFDRFGATEPTTSDGA